MSTPDRRKTQRETSTDRRAERRQSIGDHPCWIEPGRGKSLVQCHITDISKSGATLSCEQTCHLPESFTLFLTPTGSIGRKCRVVWRKDDKVGLHFMGWLAPKFSWLDDDDSLKSFASLSSSSD
jgi:hypothetical protein